MEAQLLNLTNFDMVQKICAVVLKESEFFTLLGETGSGKTSALLNFYDNHRKSCRYVRVGDRMKTLDFIEELSKQFDYRGPKRNGYMFMNYLKEYYAFVDEKELLIIDEGGRFKGPQYTILHEIRDLTEKKLGMLLSGPDYFLEDMERYTQKGIKGIPEFFRRIQLCVEMKPLSIKEIIAVCNFHKIDDVKLIQKKFIHFDNVGKLSTAIKNHLKYDEQF